MFNTTVLSVPRPVEHHTHIDMVDPSVEKGARFLNDVQKEAEARLVNAVLVDVPSIAAQLVTFDSQTSFESGVVHHHAAFKINGQNFTVRFESGDVQDRAPDLAKAIIDELALAIAKQINPATFTKRKF